MPTITFTARVKRVQCKNLSSLDKGYEIVLQGEDPNMIQASGCPADSEVNVSISYGEQDL